MWFPREVLLWVAWLHHSLPMNPDGTRRLPVNEMGEPCPWPIDPLAMCGQPIGMYHCPYCGCMVVACLPHPDYSEDDL